MRRRRRYHRPGTAPGTLAAPERPSADGVRITLINYRPDGLEERELATIEESFAYRDAGGVTWLNIEGLQDPAILHKLGETFGLHPLAMEDVLNTGQRPKTEEYDDQHFIILKLLHTGSDLEAEQVSLFLGHHYVITIQESRQDPFDPVRERIRHGRGRIRNMGADYLAYALIDVMVDQFFPVLESLGDRVEELEDEVVDNPSTETLEKIYRIKRQLLFLRRTAWPQREVVNGLQRTESSLVHKETRLFLRDVYDHCIYVMDMLETYRDLVAGMLDVYLSSISNRMNEVMKVLTVMATIFIPLTFIAGIYGMNFDPDSSPWNMPELAWYWGYPAALAAMAIVALAMLVFFRRKRWF